MIKASPGFSSKPARINDKPKASTEKSILFLNDFKNEDKNLEQSNINDVTRSQIPKIFPALASINCTEILLPALVEVADDIPNTTAKIIIQITSSKTDADKIVTPSGESSFFRSERVLAVIPTEVVVAITPKKRQRGSQKEAS